MNTVYQFNSMLLTISDGLTDDNLRDLKFLCNDFIGKKHLEKMNRGIDLFQYLKEVNKIGPGDLAFLRKLLREIRRNDLVDKMPELQNAIRDIADDEERAKVNIAVDVIVQHLGKDWKKYGRKLGLKDVKLDQIQGRHPFDLDELVMEVIIEWKKMHEENAKAADLVEALRSCKMNYTADLVEKELKANGF